MDCCQSCANALDFGSAINCSGSCGKIFHYACVGITKTHYSSWCAKIGMYWFCDTCRLNFDPAVYDREKTIMKALRELLIRTDSMDTRLGSYGENLRKINRTLYCTPQQTKTSFSSLPNDNFSQRIDEINLDDTTEDHVNRSRSCDDTSFFEVLDEVNTSIANIPDKFVVGTNKRVQIIEKPSTSSGFSRNTAHTTVSTPAAPTEKKGPISKVPPAASSINRSVPIDATKENGFRGGSCSIPLKVANKDQAPSDIESFYVTPFAPDQEVEEVKKYVIEISNVDASLVTVTKLVPRGKNIDDLSFVSFKVSVCKSVTSVIGDAWYWPDGISVRPFAPNQKNGSATRLPNLQ